MCRLLRPITLALVLGLALAACDQAGPDPEVLEYSWHREDLSGLGLSNWGLEDVCMVSRAEGWAVGWQHDPLTGDDAPLVLRYDGTWQVEDVGDLGLSGFGLRLHGVGVAPGGDVWAVGDMAGEPLIIVRHRGAWSRIEEPVGAGWPDALWDVTFQDERRAFVAGNGAVLRFVDRVYRESFASGVLRGIAWGDQGYAVGSDEGEPPEVGLPLPDVDSDGDGLSDVGEVNTYQTNPYDPDTDHDGLNDGYEVGHAPCTDPLISLADMNKDGEIDGSDFNLFRAAFMAREAAADLNCSGVVNSTDFNLFKNAWYNRGAGIAGVWESTDPTPYGTNVIETLDIAGSLNDVDVLSGGSGWAVGASGGEPLLLRHSGGGWTAVASPLAGGNFLTGVSLVSAVAGWAVGYTGDFGAPGEAILLRYLNGTWTDQSADIQGLVNSAGWGLSAVSALPTVETWAVGTDDLGATGVILRYGL